MSSLGSGNSDNKTFSGKTSAKLLSSNPFINLTDNATVIGKDAFKNKNSNGNVFVGNLSGNQNAGTFNVCVGNSTGTILSTGSVNNTCIGSLSGNTSVGMENTFVGFSAGKVSKAGSSNVCVGAMAGEKLSGNRNVALGHRAAPGSFQSGSDNVIIGANSGNVVGDNNVVIGNGVYSEETHTSSTVNIGNAFVSNGETGDLSVRLKGTAEGVVAIDKHGNLSRTAKTFVIDNPTSPTRYLVHSCLEGNQSCVFYRGIATIGDSCKVLVELPHYYQSIALDGATVQATPTSCSILWCSSVSDGCFWIHASVPCTTHWLVIAERADIPRLNPEPLKTETTVSGNGPYTYIECPTNDT